MDGYSGSKDGGIAGGALPAAADCRCSGGYAREYRSFAQGHGNAEKQGRVRTSASPRTIKSGLQEMVAL